LINIRDESIRVVVDALSIHDLDATAKSEHE